MLVLDLFNLWWFQSALLIHTAAVQQNDESLLHQQRTGHPLDSQQTTDVLKYVLLYHCTLTLVDIVADISESFSND